MISLKVFQLIGQIKLIPKSRFWGFGPKLPQSLRLARFIWNEIYEWKLYFLSYFADNVAVFLIVVVVVFDFFNRVKIESHLELRPTLSVLWIQAQVLTTVGCNLELDLLCWNYQCNWMKQTQFCFLVCPNEDYTAMCGNFSFNHSG